MLKFIITILQVFVGVYCLGDIARKNSKFDAFLTLLETGYGQFNNKIQNACLKNGIAELKKIYGFFALFFFFIFIILSAFFPGSNEYMFICTTGFVFSLLGRGGISWWMQHKQVILSNAGITLLIIIFPFLLGLLERQSGVSLLKNNLEPLLNSLAQLGFVVNPDIGVWWLASILSVGLLLMVFILYISTWVLSVPIIFVSVLFTVTAISFSKLVNKISPGKAFNGLMVILFIVLTVINNYLL